MGEGWVRAYVASPDPHPRPFSQGEKGVSNRPRPLRHLVHYRFVNFRLRNAGALGNFERMIAAIDNVKRRRQAQLLDQPPNLVRSSKSIACALREKHRRATVFQMFLLPLVMPA